jgi:hypothetical protein
LAPFVHKYRDEIEQELEEMNASFTNEEAKEKYLDNKTYKYVVQQMQNFVFGLNTPSRW